MSTWEPATHTEGRGLRSDLRRLFALGDPRRTLYRDAHYFTATVELDPAAGRWLPPGIRLAEPARADVFTAFFPDCNYGSVYREAGLFVHIKAGRRNVLGLAGFALPRVVAFTPSEHPIEVREVIDFELQLGGSAGRPPVPVRPLTPLFTMTRLRPRVL
ncbi:hypothetical protein ACIQUM_42805 [Amycolatopsis azurea]|uniref:hypothetical protein n=1 Tax=Amycolatopsis azurea TaxID=36819 RepID=UPI0038077AA4